MQKTETHSLGERILKAAALIGAAHVVFKFAGLLLTAVMGRYLPARVVDSIYVVAFEGCIFTVFLIGEQVIAPTFLPVFLREKESRGEQAAWHFANTVLTLQALILLGVTAWFEFAPASVIRLLTAWDATTHPEQFGLACDGLTAIAPALVFLSLGSTTYMLLTGYKRFFMAAFGDAAWKFAALVFLVVGVGILGVGHRALTVGLLIGSTGKLITHVIGLARQARYLRPSLQLHNPALRSLLYLMLPLVAGIVFSRARDNFNNIWVLSHLDADGLLQANFFGRKLYQSIGWLVPYALSIAMFPFLCELVDRNDKAKFGQLLTQSTNMLITIFLPLALVCAVLAEPISALLFRGGRFTDAAVHWTALAMAANVLVLPAYATEFLLMQAFFAQRRMFSVTAVGVACSLLSMAATYIGVVMLNATGSAALVLVGLSFTVSRTVKVIALVLVLKRGLPAFPLAPLATCLAKTMLAGGAAAAAAALTVRLLTAAGLSSVARLQVLLKLGAAAACAGAVFLGLVWLLRIHEPAEMLRWALQRMRRGRGAQAPAAAGSTEP